MVDKFDLLLKNGHLIDPVNELDGSYDIAIKHGRIAKVQPDIDNSESLKSVDISNLVVTPGLIDLHVHAYHTRVHKEGNLVGSLNADAHFLKEGVTTCVDTGTAGADEFEHFRETVIDRSRTRILAYVNISAPGMGDHEQIVENLNPKRAAEAAAAHDDVVVGIKTAHYWTKLPFDSAHPPWASVDNSVEAGELCMMPVMVDFWPRPPERSYQDLILKHLRAGDIHTHVFARQFPIVDDQGNVHEFMREARQRGIHFDLGHGAASFWFRNAVPAIHDKFPPDSISTDLHMGNINGHVHSMLDTMSKCVAMGMPIQEVIYRSTVTPAKALRKPNLGHLSIGNEADISVFGILEGNFCYRDCGWGVIDGKHRFECALTLKGGEVVWDRHGLTCPHFTQAPENSGYWQIPEIPVPVPRLWRPDEEHN